MPLRHSGTFPVGPAGSLIVALDPSRPAVADDPSRGFADLGDLALESRTTQWPVKSTPSLAARSNVNPYAQQAISIGPISSRYACFQQPGSIVVHRSAQRQDVVAAEENSVREHQVR